LQYYDLVLENGIHVLGAPLAESPLGGRFRGKSVVHALCLRGPYRLPFLGTLLRNFWAKRHGAILS